MKNRILIFILLVGTTVNAQGWKYETGGSDFDGKYKTTPSSFLENYKGSSVYLNEYEEYVLMIMKEYADGSECLIDNNNALEQNRLVALTGINKVKVSRILMELEERNVISKTNLGNTKLIVLKV